MSVYEQQVIKHGDYSDEVIKEWVTVNKIAPYFIPEDESVYVINGYITARCFHRIDQWNKEKAVPALYPRKELGVFDYCPSVIKEWPLVESIESVAERLSKESE